jgi:hypothetical protein
MWLEDDWDLLIPFDIKQLIDSDYGYIGFHFHHFFEFSFNPTMWSKDFFVKNVYEPFTASAISIDPEQLLINYHNQTRAENPNHLKNVKRINFNGVFEDAGREWGEHYNLKKWNKNKTGESVSYEKVKAKSIKRICILKNICQKIKKAILLKWELPTESATLTL